VKDYLLKLKQYFLSNPDYWKLTSVDNKDNFEAYPLSFSDRLITAHYVDFDTDGIPMFPSKSGELVHFITGMCSYGFANWEMFLKTGIIEYAQKVVAVADYLIKSIEVVEESSMLYDYESDTRNTTGVACAMNQGEAISVLVRAYSYTKNINYLISAEKLFVSFNITYGKTGVITKIEDSIWFLEGGKKILNGHIYALLGLYDLSKVSRDKKVEFMFYEGVKSVKNLLSQFDSGFWSWYWIDKPKYMASAMYHNLHICQLNILFNLTGDNDFKVFSLKFKHYAESPIYRILSGFFLFFGKIRKKF
jgi:hypothetical protein